MTTKADKLREKGRQQAQRSAPETEVREKARPIRITLDLAPVLHRELTRWCAEAAGQLDVPRVPAAAVARALLHQLLDEDSDLSAEILRRLPAELDRRTQ